MKIMKVLGINQNKAKEVLFPLSLNSDFTISNINKNMGQ